MGFQRGIDGPDGFRDRVGRNAGAEEERRVARSSVVAAGTLACPDCDAPIALGDRPLSPAAPLGCPFCGHEGPVRDFLSFAAPTRPTRVVVRVVLGRPQIERRTGAG
ncbi:hypothetical protein [Conexibacter arvalis]|uniref:Putative RNA-binding Zn-ribbon protein involved in translation (DUF1610 family) n=1 Tax=Conexibacter arvalis TaxID=912552 RepID=A0A840IJ69_9ACTN|nr:hypothetical protein [Conexibacter arvalis]MBB4665062.1 putative RNA-binding Zn-ribbon protein involved in translation (DUF1610 family) [Conexibacter arvalis]